MSEILKGKLGFKGERGYSTYEIAVQNGFEGTEEEWLEAFGIQQIYDYIDAKKEEIEATCKSKGDFAVLTGSVSTSELSLGGKRISYPSGFTADNCVVISAMTKNSTLQFYQTFFIELAESGNSMNGLVVRLTEDDIVLNNVACYMKEIPYEYKIVLMKVS